MLLLALVVFGVTAWFLGLRAGGIASVVSLAALIGAQVVPGSAVAIYALHILWIAGLVWLGPRVSRLRSGKRPPENQVARWLRRGKALGSALWRSRR